VIGWAVSGGHLPVDGLLGRRLGIGFRLHQLDAAGGGWSVLAPALASASVSLNTSVLYIGQR